MREVQPNYRRADGYGQDHHHRKYQDQQRVDELDPYGVPAKADDEPRVCPVRTSPSPSPSPPSRPRSPLPSPSLKVQVRPIRALPRLSDPTVQALGIPVSNYVLAPNPLGFQFDHSDLSRFRNGAHGRCGVDVDVDMDVDGDDGGEEGDGKPMTISEAVWRRWEQVGELAKGAGELFRYAYDRDGNDYRPDMTHVQAIRLVIAASPRKMMTLAQIYQAIEERWPWHKAAGSTWKNSIRHNLSLNDCFINAERPTHEGGSGKGGYWTVNDKLTGKTARKLKRSLRSELENEMENDAIEVDGRAGGPSHPHPYPQPNAHATYFPSSFSPTHPHPHYPHSQTHNINDMYTTETLWDPPARPVRSLKRYRLSQPPLPPSGSGSVSASYQPYFQLYPHSRPRQHPQEHELPHERRHEHTLERARPILANEYTRSPSPSLYTHFPEYKRDPHLRLGISLSVPTFAHMQSHSRGALPHAPELMDQERDGDEQRDREQRVRDSVTPFGVRVLAQERERGKGREQRGYYHPYPTPKTSGEIEREADYNDHEHYDHTQNPVHTQNHDHTQNHVHTQDQNQKAKYVSRDIPFSLWTPPGQGAGQMGGREKGEDRDELQRAADGVELLALAAAKIQG